MKKLILVVAFLLYCSTAHAYLIDRGSFAYEDGTGNTGVVNLIYDVDYDITWVGRGNFAESSGFDDDGIMNWYTATAWIDGLTIGDYTDWRLPTALNRDDTGPVSGLGEVENGSEMNHLFYGELGGFAMSNITNSGDPDLSLFPDIKNNWYWSKTVSPYYPYPQDMFVWGVAFNQGYSELINKNSGYYTLAVHEGDVAKPIPEPSTWVLLGIGLIGITVVSFRKKRSFFASY